MNNGKVPKTVKSFNLAGFILSLLLVFVSCTSPLAPKIPQLDLMVTPSVGLSSSLDEDNVAIILWFTERADSVTLWPYIGLTGPNGEARIPIIHTTTFTLTATNIYGDTIKRTTLIVE